jgi:hypothetical protein
MAIKVSVEIELDENTKPEVRDLVLKLLSMTVQDADLGVALGEATATPLVEARKPRKRRAPDRPKLLGSPAEQWTTFIGRAPERTKAFVDLLEKKHPDFLMQAEAMAALDIDAPRAIGGLTGSMRRWAVADKITLPWDATKIDGERAWVWRGFDEEGALNASSNAFQEVHKVNLPPESYEEYFSRLPERSQRFLQFLESVGTATVRDAMEALDIESPKALGGLAGSLNRWGRAAGLPVPFEPARIGEQKAYRWIGINGGVAAHPKASAPTTATVGAVSDQSEDTVRQLASMLPDRHVRFLNMLVVEGVLSMPKLLGQLGLTRAKAAKEMVETIGSVCEANDLVLPFVEDVSPAGVYTYALRGWRAAPETTEQDGEFIVEMPSEKTAGVGVRRRRA